MQFLTFRAGARLRVGLVEPGGQRILDLAAAAEGEAPATMLELIELGDDAVALARDLLSRLDALPASAWAPADIRIVAPIPRPRKNIFAVGLNYVAHNQEFTGSSKLPEHPILFTKAPTSVVGPGDAIELRPDLSNSIDYEGELAVVIGRAGRDIAPEEAEAHIFGYTIVNDVTARDLQKRTGQWFIGKSLDSFCPMGPYLVHRSAIDWPVRLDIRTRVNGELRQDSNTEKLLFDIPTLIASLSAGISLEPGDIIATGTPEGVGMGFAPPRFLSSGDEIEIEIEHLGLLRNPVH